jgi:hypothetical protein
MRAGGLQICWMEEPNETAQSLVVDIVSWRRVSKENGWYR